MGETEGLICLIIYAVIFAAFMAAKRRISAEDAFVKGIKEQYGIDLDAE